MKSISDLNVESLWGVRDFIKKDDCVIFLGELENMPEHCVFIYKNNTYAGYHTDNFIKEQND